MNDNTFSLHTASQTAANTQKQDIEQLLRDGYTIQLKPQGYSMYPLFIPGRDEAFIESVPVNSLKKGDVTLYRRDQSILVLHRICRIDDSGFYMVGDNQSEIEGPLRPDQLRGKLVGFVRKGRSFSVQNPIYRFLCALWLFMLPVRPLCFKLSAFFKKYLIHKKHLL